MTFPFVRHLANLARSTVSKAREKSLPKADIEPRLDSASLSLNQEQLDLGPIYDVSCCNCLSNVPLMNIDLGAPSQDVLSGMNLDNEKWATLIGWPDLGNTPVIDLM